MRRGSSGVRDGDISASTSRRRTPHLASPQRGEGPAAWRCGGELGSGFDRPSSSGSLSSCQKPDPPIIPAPSPSGSHCPTPGRRAQCWRFGSCHLPPAHARRKGRWWRALYGAGMSGGLGWSSWKIWNTGSDQHAKSPGKFSTHAWFCDSGGGVKFSQDSEERL